jgi:glycosyltransferase involved in cell wall biosynthesis
MKVLHLASWFPCEQYPYNGDFIQRQLKALSLYREVTVIFVVKDDSMPSGACRVVKNSHHPNYQEWIAYYGSYKTGISFLDRYFSYKKYLKNFEKLIDEYIELMGKPNLLHVHVAMNAGLIAHSVFKKWKIPYVLTEHSTIYHMTAHENLWNRWFFWRNLNLQIIREARAIYPVSYNLGKQIQKLVPSCSFKVIDNVVDTSIFYYKPSFFVKPFRFIHVSSMNNAKNVEGILYALAKLDKSRSDWTCTMVGPASEELKALSYCLRIDHKITWTGEVTYAKVASYMQESHAHVLFSLYENQPCVILEALCCGLPVIVTNVGGVREVVNTSNGYVLVSINTETLCAVMKRIMAEYKIFDRQKISEEAKARFSYEAVGKKMEDEYEKVV